MNDLKKQYEQETGLSPLLGKPTYAISSLTISTPEYVQWIEAKLQTPQPEGVKPEAFWNDNQVMSFVNWYIKLKNLDSRYELENQFIIDSFKAGDAAEKWKAAETK